MLEINSNEHRYVMVEDVEILIPARFCWIQLSGFRWEVENVSAANQRPGRPSCFFFRSAQKVVREHWDHASCQVSLNSIQRLQRRSLKCLSQSEAKTLYFGSVRKTQTWLRTFLPVKFLNSVKGFQRSSRKFLSKSETWAVILYFDRPENHKLSRWCWDLASCQVSLNSVMHVTE